MSTDPVTIARFQERAHREGVTRLWQEVFGYEAAHNDPALSLAKKTAVRDGLFFVAIAGEEVIGSIMAGYDGHRGWLYSLAVRPERRNRGIGSMLMKEADRALADLGCMKINLQILPGNEGVLKLYERLGYEVEKRVNMGKRIPENARMTGREGRVSIRFVTMSDAGDVQLYAADERLHATCNLPSPYPKGGAAAFLAGALDGMEKKTRITFAVLEAGSFAGLMGLNDVRIPDGSAELDYWIGFPFWNRGIATAAAALAIRHAFGELGLHTLFSGGLVRNTGSIRVLEKNGFQKIGEHVYGGPWKERFGGEILGRYSLRAE